ncbi:MAG: hypothetical protein ABSG03_02985 [Bryobacteraceae bacterium]|jgi:hypothetical protein
MEGGDYAVERIAVGLAGGLGIEHAGFDGPGAALAPAGGGHFLDHAELDIAGGPEAVDVLLEEHRETRARFVVHNAIFGAQAVTDGVLRRVELSRGCGRPFGEGAVGSGRSNSSR